MWNNYNNFDNKHDNNNININGNKCILFIALYAKVALEKSDRKKWRWEKWIDWMDPCSLW